MTTIYHAILSSWQEANKYSMSSYYRLLADYQIVILKYMQQKKLKHRKAAIAFFTDVAATEYRDLFVLEDPALQTDVIDCWR